MNAISTPVITVHPRIGEALWARFVAPVLAGTEPCVRQLTVAGVENPASLFAPIGAGRHRGPD